MALLGLAVLAVLGLTAEPASADPVKPTNYRSRVLKVTPALPAGVHVEVVGGDGFLEVRSNGHHELVVLDQIQDRGFPPRPYLRIRPDGTVQINRNSIGYYTNRTRYGGVAPPLSLQRPGGLPPDWKTVGHSGRYAWHDHRIHWMSPGRPPSLRGSTGKVSMGGPHGDWVVQLTVDGQPTQVEGELVLHAAPNPLLWLALAAGIAVGGILLARRAPLVVAIGGSLVGATVAVVVGWGQHLAEPPGTGGSALTWLLPAVALAGAVAAMALRRPAHRVSAVLVTASALGGWLFMRWTVLTKAVLPTYLLPIVDRAGTAVVLGTAVAVATIAVRSGLVAPSRSPGPASGSAVPAP